MEDLDRLYKTSGGLLLIKWNSRMKSLSLGSGMLFNRWKSKMRGFIQDKWEGV